MTSSPLFTRVAELIGDHRAHRPGGVGERLLGGDVVQVVAAAAAERAAARGEHQPAHLVGAAAAQALGQRAVLGVDRDDLARASRRAVTSGPPMISDSLLASARVLPASSAASVGRSPTAPVMPLSTTSHSIAAAATEASSPRSANAGRELLDLRRGTGRAASRRRSAPRPGTGPGWPGPRRAPGCRWSPVEPSSTTSRRVADLRRLSADLHATHPAGIRLMQMTTTSTHSAPSRASRRRPRPPAGAPPRHRDPRPALEGEVRATRAARRPGGRHGAAGVRRGRRRRRPRRRRRQLADRPRLRDRGGQRRQRAPRTSWSG